jgi:hypothetical protein
MRRAGFASVGIFLLKEELNGSIFLLPAVEAVRKGLGRGLKRQNPKRGNMVE